MPDPISSPLTAKIIAGIGGFVGGALFMAFLRPKNVWDAAIRSSVSTTVAIIGYSPVLDYLQWAPSSDHVVAVSSSIGFLSWTVLSIIAKILLDIEHDKLELNLPFLHKAEEHHVYYEHHEYHNEDEHKNK